MYMLRNYTHKQDLQPFCFVCKLVFVKYFSAQVTKYWKVTWNEIERKYKIEFIVNITDTLGMFQSLANRGIVVHIPTTQRWKGLFWLWCVWIHNTKNMKPISVVVNTIKFNLQTKRKYMQFMSIHTERKRKFSLTFFAFSSFLLSVHRPYIYTRMWS